MARSGGVGAAGWLEYPIGTTVYKSTGSIHGVRISRNRGHVAFIEDPSGLGSGGRVRIVARDGSGRALTRDWGRARGLAWSPDSTEVWFTAGDGRANRALHAVTLDGRERVLLESPGSLTLWDAAVDGRLLLSRDDERMSVLGTAPGAPRERDLSVFDDAGLAAVSPDGALLLFGDRFGVYLRKTDGSPPIKLAL